MLQTNQQIEVDPEFIKTILDQLNKSQYEFTYHELGNKEKIVAYKLSKKKYDYLKSLQSKLIDSNIISGDLLEKQKTLFTDQYLIVFKETNQTLTELSKIINDEKFTIYQAFELANQFLIMLEQLSNNPDPQISFWIKLKYMKIIQKKDQQILKMFPIFNKNIREPLDLLLIPNEQLDIIEKKENSIIGQYVLKKNLNNPPLTPSQCVWISASFLYYLITKQPPYDTNLNQPLDEYIKFRKLRELQQQYSELTDDFIKFLQSSFGKTEERQNISQMKDFFDSKLKELEMIKNKINYPKAKRNEDGFIQIELCKIHDKKCIYINQKTEELYCKKCLIQEFGQQ